MSFLSKAWKGIKKVVKKSAFGIKKLAKKVITSTPGGDKLWELGGKIGTKVLEGVGKITNALGPVGMIALSVLAPYAAPLWASFGAAASAAGGFWGTVGTAIYNGANWVGGTLSSMTSGISKGIAQLGSGSVQGASDAVVKGFSDAFTGKAGRAAVDEGINKAIASAAGNAAVKQAATEVAKDNFLDSQLQKTAQANQSSIGGYDVLNQKAGTAIQQSTGTMATEITKQGILQPVEQSTFLQTAGQMAKGVAKGVASMASDIQMPQTQQPSFSVGGSQPLLSIGARGEGGMGSTGGEFLSQDMQRRIQEASNRMSRGFGGNY
ncbi:hypothetical protein [Pseudoalteromonas phage vB_PtuP_Slicky01]|nr:hypothetical protein [Pseudoalteromonas phage vB_PtuP_Slicky01]